MSLKKLEVVIRRCPVCLKDTEQIAYYANKPDFNIAAKTPTLPEAEVIIKPEEQRHHDWHIVARCSVCAYVYDVSGINERRLRKVDAEIKEEEVNLVHLCCDVCYNEEYVYTISSIFINLSGGKSIYMCERHAKEIEEQNKKFGSYESLVKRMEEWRIKNANKPRLIELDNKKFIISNSSGSLDKIFAVLERNKKVSVENLITEILSKGRNEELEHRVGIDLNSLKDAGFVMEKSIGLIRKSKELGLTEIGRKASEIMAAHLDGP